MTTNDILTLARAGFTAQQIAGIAAAEAQQPAAAAPAAPAAPAQQPAAAAPAAPTQQPAAAADPNAALMAEIAGLRTAMQNAALLGAAQPPAMSADDALAAIINPPDVLKALEQSKGV